MVHALQRGSPTFPSLEDKNNSQRRLISNWSMALDGRTEGLMDFHGSSSQSTVTVPFLFRRPRQMIKISFNKFPLPLRNTQWMLSGSATVPLVVDGLDDSDDKEDEHGKSDVMVLSRLDKDANTDAFKARGWVIMAEMFCCCREGN
jgi:hypothetical protein